MPVSWWLGRGGFCSYLEAFSLELVHCSGAALQGHISAGEGRIQFT